MDLPIYGISDKAIWNKSVMYIMYFWYQVMEILIEALWEPNIFKNKPKQKHCGDDLHIYLIFT